MNMAKAAAAEMDSGGPGDDADLAPPGQAGGGHGPAEPSGGSGLTRVTVNLTRPAAQALDALTEATGYSKTDSINRAIQIYLIVQGIMERNSGALTITHEDGHVERVHII